MDAIFRALANPSRRRLLDRLYQRDGQTLTEMCAVLDISRIGVMQHLRVLREAGLVHSQRDGKAVLYRLAPEVAKAADGNAINLGCCRISFDEK